MANVKPPRTPDPAPKGPPAGKPIDPPRAEVKVEVPVLKRKDPSLAPRVLAIAPGGELRLREVIHLSGPGVSVQFWIRLDPASQGGQILLFANDKRRGGLALEQTDNLGLRARYMGENAKDQVFQADDVLPDAGFGHITLTFSPKGEICLYRDGSLAARAQGVPLHGMDLNFNRIGKKAVKATNPREQKSAPQAAQPVGARRHRWDALRKDPNALKEARQRSLALQKEAEFSGVMTELRVWDRALSASEVEMNWLYRKVAPLGLALRMPLDGTDARIDGPVAWKDLDASPVKDAPPAPRATIRGEAVLLSAEHFKQENEPVDMSQAGGEKTQALFRPRLDDSRFVVDLMPVDDKGRSLSGQELTVMVDRAACLIRRDGDKKIFFVVEPDKPFTLSAGPLGKARVEVLVNTLIAPVFKVRHAGMQADEWALFAPDRYIFKTLASVTADELTKGLAPSASAKFGGKGLVASGAENLVPILQATMGAAYRFSHVEAAPGEAPPPDVARKVVSFEDTAKRKPAGAGASVEPVAPVAPAPTKGRKRLKPIADGGQRVTYQLRKAAPTRRVIGPVTRRSFAGPSILAPQAKGPQAFGIFDDIGDFFEDTIIDPLVDIFGGGVDALGGLLKDAGDLAWAINEKTGELAAGLTDAVGDGARLIGSGLENVAGTVESLGQLAVKTVINGIEVAGTWVMETVEDGVNIAMELLKKVGTTIKDAINFLASLFEWGDILETAEALLSCVNEVMANARVVIPSTLKDMIGKVSTLEATLLEALGGNKAESNISGSRGLQIPIPSFELSPLNFLMEKLTAHLPKLDIQLDFLAPLAAVVDPAMTRFGNIAEILKAEMEKSNILNLIETGVDLINSGVDVLVGIVRSAIKTIAAVMREMLEIGVETIPALIDLVHGALNTRINIPVLTAFVEATVLGGKELTIGRLLCVLGAIPATLIHKAVTGSDHGPFAGKSGSVVSFSVESDARAFAYGTTYKALKMIAIPVYAALGAAATQVKEKKVQGLLGGFQCVVSVWIDVLLGCPGVEYLWTGAAPSNAAVIVLSSISWVWGLLSTILSGVTSFEDMIPGFKKSLKTFPVPKDGVSKLSGFIGLSSGILGAVGGGLYFFSEEGKGGAVSTGAGIANGITVVRCAAEGVGAGAMVFADNPKALAVGLASYGVATASALTALVAFVANPTV